MDYKTNLKYHFDKKLNTYELTVFSSSLPELRAAGPFTGCVRGKISVSSLHSTVRSWRQILTTTDIPLFSSATPILL